jgi:hypothetical protein
VIDHHTLQVERPGEVAAFDPSGVKYIAPERLIISSDCGMGREGMSWRHAIYKMVAMVLGTNVVRQGSPRSAPGQWIFGRRSSYPPRNRIAASCKPPQPSPSIHVARTRLVDRPMRHIRVVPQAVIPVI